MPKITITFRYESDEEDEQRDLDHNIMHLLQLTLPYMVDNVMIDFQDDENS